MPDKDPTNWGWGMWLLALLPPLAGGFVNWYQKIKSGQTKVFNVVELIGEVFTSGFVGLAVFMGLAALDYPAGMCAALGSVCGHMSTRFLFLLERAMENKLSAMFPPPHTHRRKNDVVANPTGDKNAD